jgi:hypothetical protein
MVNELTADQEDYLEEAAREQDYEAKLGELY